MSHILWRDAAKEAPPGHKTVLVWCYGEAAFGWYNPTGSYQKGCELPNEKGRAVWCVNNSEGVTDVRWWASIQDPDAQWASP